MRYDFTRRSLTVLGLASSLVVVLGASTIVSPMALRVAEAQSTEADSVTAVQLPPWLPGEDFDPVNGRENLSTDAAAAPGTPSPTAPTVSGDGATVVDAPAESGALTTSLGGSDVAVSSVGGSYEVDSPKKRSKGRK